ncbi:acetyl-CoA carboxylase biotin carboxyl carrier protein subunit [Leptospira jelokensis]|uniref:acetyl-CoA carboxylase biotin carboxyl carrier protein subunit n=1 Tax=Leptospira jelokensis TaxID=2484931 RepID=UPI0010914BDE|nr:acetyl-CoA carboxylase biotin carboxyl carrier protein subunit [Leptospira jelokensis]TGM01567.1 biotin/lipoyl-binding protein [Leptospira jelokensis]
MDYRFESKQTPVSVHLSGDRIKVRLGSESFQFRTDVMVDGFKPNDQNLTTVQMKDGSLLKFMKVRNEVFFHWNGETWSVKLAERSYELAGQTSPEIKSPMPGKVVQIATAVGSEHSVGETLLILEAMKMENAIKAPYPCRVEEIRKQSGDLVQQDEVLLILHRIEAKIT